MPQFVIALLLGLLSLGSAAETMRVSAVTAPGTPWHEGWLHFEKQLQRRPQLIQPVFYLGGQLGSEESALSQLRRGRTLHEVISGFAPPLKAVRN